jgi:hypothetical protein
MIWRKMVRTKSDELKTWIAEKIREHDPHLFFSGKPSPSRFVKKYLEEEGKTITRQTMSEYLKGDLSAHLKLQDFSKNLTIREIREAMKNMENIWGSEDESSKDKTQAMNSWRFLNKQRIDYETHLREMEVRKIEAGRPNYLIQFNPASAERKCPKCGHRWYDVDEKTDKEEKEGEETKDDSKEKEPVL